MTESSATNSPNIVLVGFSYTGKTTYGKLVAERLGWRFVDTDDVIEEREGRAIPEIFAQPNGEERFRQLEREILAEACAATGAVIATGGGAILNADNRRVMAERNAVICLESQPETIEARLRAMSTDPSQPIRPLLAHPDPLARIRELKAARQPLYAIADWTVHTDHLSPDEVVDEVQRGTNIATRRLEQGRPLENMEPASSSSPASAYDDIAHVVTTPTDSYPIYVGSGNLASLGARMRSQGLKGGKASLILDAALAPLYEEATRESLAEAGFEVDAFHLPSGESSKTLSSASQMYDWLLERRAERADPIVALGGGVVCDTAGFVASTYLRGVPLVQVPTSTLAMADASIGGKTAVDHPKGKNLIGAFYQPSLVLEDIDTLKSLPQRALREGFAEVIKMALILDANLFEFLEQNVDALLNLKEEPVVHALSRCAALKGWVVSQDEKEGGLRAILNYGHTLGHALEAVTSYESILHGEGVSIGMMAAGELSRRHGLLSSEELARQKTLLERFRLPTALPNVDLDSILDAMTLDKKSQGGSVRWILLNGIGEAASGQTVELVEVREVAAGLLT